MAKSESGYATSTPMNTEANAAGGPAPSELAMAPPATNTVKVFELPPRSPSETAALTAEGPAPPPATGPAPSAGTSRAVSTRSRRSAASRQARVIQVQYEAERRLAEIKKKELEIEAALVRKQLEVEVSNIEAESTDDEASVIDDKTVRSRVDQWLQGSSTQQDRPGEREEHTDAPAKANYERSARAARTTRGEGSHDRRDARGTEARRTTTPSRESGTENRIAEALEKIVRIRPLPRQAIELPQFSGNPLDWLPFKAAMRDSTDLHRLTATDNLNRLRASLRGEAKETVAMLLHTATDPQQIMNTLERCYGRPETIVRRALEELRKLQKMSNSDDINKFAVKLQNVVSVLETIDRKGYLQNPMLAQEVVDKMSPHIINKWCEFAQNAVDIGEPEIVTLSKFLNREADLVARYTRPCTIRETSKPVPNQKKRREAAYTITEEEIKVNCLYCGGEHAVPKCENFLKLEVNDRWNWVKTTGACFKCCQKKHRRNMCKARACGVNDCRRPHHRLLHADRAPDRRDGGAAAAAAPPATQPEVVMSAAARSERLTTLLKVCPVIIEGPAGTARVHALLDEGSTVTLLDDDLAKQIGAEGPASPLHIRGVNSIAEKKESRRVRIRVRGENETEEHPMTARTVKDFELRGQPATDVDRYKHLSDLPMTSSTDARPRLLIGADNWELIVTRELRTGGRREPAASKTWLGWVLHGTTPARMLVDKEDASYLCVQSLEELVKGHFEVEALGVSKITKTPPDDAKAIKKFEETARRIDKRYEVGLPWRDDDATMPPSYDNALKRLVSIERKMKKDPSFAHEYRKQIENLLAKGYAEECQNDEIKSPIAWYLPHFAVRNPNKPAKLRLVFDAAATSSGTSLNDRLLEGPDLLKSLPGILFRFRERPVAVTADIAEMFLQVKIRAEDQPAQMFLWRDGDSRAAPRRYKMTSMIFGATSSPFLAHSVRNRNARDHENRYPEAAQAITDSHYMDDYVDSFHNEEEAIRTAIDVSTVHAEASFNLRGWNSNSEKFLKSIPEERRAQSVTTLGTGSQTDRTLGLLWDSAEDKLGFNTTFARVSKEVRERARPPTKRELLSAVMSLYDPLGLLSHFTIKAKITLQSLWRLKLSWDESIPEEEARQFDEWMTALEEAARLRLPRCYFSEHNLRSLQLHVFCDASSQAYATAIYWRITTSEGEVRTTLAAAKAKVAPLKALTIPRLELQAAVIGVRLAELVVSKHRWKPDTVTYWTDSTTVWHWIQTNAKRYTPFVAHRLGEIAEYTKPEQWRWLPTDENVADEATRPLKEDKLSERDRWFVGPSFLTKEEDRWPTRTPDNQGHEEENTHVVQEENADTNGGLPDISRFSSYRRLIRSTALVLLFIEKCRTKNKKLELQVRHLEQATKLWIERTQKDSFSVEAEALKDKKTISRRSRIFKLDPMLVDGLLRIRGRINHAHVPEEMKRPVVLDGKHQFTRLLIMNEHKKTGHAGTERVVNDLRQRYHILHMRPTVRKIAYECQLCRVRKATPTVPPPGDLPLARTAGRHRPFTYVGVDYFGPMMVTIGRRHEKRWGALFTCLTTRAVHLELAASLTLDSAIMALRRMAARRGWPRLIYSDNGTNFRGADRELRAAYDAWTPDLKAFAAEQGVDWRFIPPGAPHMGGAWERLIRTVKKALELTLSDKAPKEEILQTVLVEAEHTVNARPLTHVSVNPGDAEALTPNHFLLGSSTGLPLTGPCTEADRATWRKAQALADHFWSRWIKEYLPELVPRGRSDGNERPLSEGDLVVVVDAQLPRNVWPRGVVAKTFPGRDGKVRTAEIKTNGGLFIRPVTKLAVLPIQREAATEAPPGGECCGQPAPGEADT